MYPILTKLLHCWCTKFTWPINRVHHDSRTAYVVCLTCGAEFAYDVDKMKRGAKISQVNPQGIG